MSIKSILTGFFPKQIKKKLKYIAEIGDFGHFHFDNHSGIKKDIIDNYGFSGDLLDIFANNKNVLVDKWHHYIPIYDRYFSRFRGTDVRFLEIGVSKGGSLQMWRKYFGKQATIFGLDINPDCAKYQGIHGEVRIGSQDDVAFLKEVISEMGGVDVVLDDGSHQMKHIMTTLKSVLPDISDNGIYMIEDLHTAYWRDFGGGLKAPSNFFNVVRTITDDMHHWYHGRRMRMPEISKHCRSIHIHDSVVVFEKGKIQQPTYSEVI